MRFIKFYAAALIISVTFISCEEDPVTEDPIIEDPVVNDTSEVDILNEWIWTEMNTYYFWEDEIDSNLYPTENEPEDFFYSLLSTNDRFSWIVDDYQALINSFNNIELSTGMSPYFINIGNGNEVIVIIEYVSEGSPADSAGILRGDIITEINGETLNINNYADLFYSDNVTLGFGELKDNTIVPINREIKLEARVIEQNPIVHYEIIDYQDQKTGYLVYTGFSAGDNDKWVDSLDQVLTDFQDSGISELVVDLRYNPGGRVNVANHLAASVAPSDISANKSVFVKYQWNTLLNNYFLQEDGENSSNLVLLFEDSPTVNLNLQNIYFLTSPHSASASELIIIGLEPYMNVMHIGENTYGKPFGSITIKDTEDPPRHSWAMQPIVFQYTNAEGFTDFIDGLEPDYYIDDDLFFAKPFGDITDPLLAKALEEITGINPALKKTYHDRLDFKYDLLKDPVREIKNNAVADIN
ncbi:MAG TPA: S41 family peptidase [Bacteroidales bacterium]|nr:S41 family peptidase [Bacteroidales bacterium]